VSLRKFVEIFSNKQPTTARELMGFPIRLEEREISAVEDDRIMADGRPAYAWWNEIQMLRQREPEIQRREMALREKMIVLHIAEWAMVKDFLTGDTLLRIKQLPLMAKDPALELLEHPEKYVTVAGDAQGEGRK
jgi:hypothetical protein